MANGFRLPIPESTASIIDRSLQERLGTIEQPTFEEQTLPQITKQIQEGLITSVSGIAKRRNVKNAIRTISEIESIPEIERTPEQKKLYQSAFLNLGIDSPDVGELLIKSRKISVPRTYFRNIGGRAVKISMNESGDIIDTEDLGASTTTSNITQETKETIARDLADAKIRGRHLSQLLGRGGADLRTEIYALAKKFNPNLDISKTDLDFERREKLIALASGVHVRLPIALAESTFENLDDIQELANMLDNPNFTPAGRFKFRGRLLLGSKLANTYQALVIDTSSQIAQIFRGGGIPDIESSRDAKKLLDPSKSPGAIKGTIEGTKDVLTRRIESLYSIGSEIGIPTPQTEFLKKIERHKKKSISPTDFLDGEGL